MFYLLVYLACGLLYALFLSLADPQLVPPTIKWGMAITLFCFASMASIARYVEKRYLRYVGKCWSCKHTRLRFGEGPCATCDDYRCNWEDRANDLQ